MCHAHRTVVQTIGQRGLDDVRVAGDGFDGARGEPITSRGNVDRGEILDGSGAVQRQPRSAANWCNPHRAVRATLELEVDVGAVSRQDLPHGAGRWEVETEPARPE